MHYSKSVKTFNLATSLNDYNDQISKNVQNRLKIHVNLFDQQAPERAKIIRFEENRAFEYCGVKQLKSYYDRARRVSKDKRRDTMPMSLGYSRHSVVSNKDDEILSKWQILQKVQGKLDQGESVESGAISKLDSTRRQKTSDKIYEFNINSKRGDIRTTQTSILKIKNSHQNYKQSWQKVQRKTEQTKGFPSLLRLATQSRSISIKKQVNERKFKKENINERMWATILRGQTQLKNIYDKSVTKFPQSNQKFTISGKSKLQQQKQWINCKGDQGYKFQLLKKTSCKN